MYPRVDVIVVAAAATIKNYHNVLLTVHAYVYCVRVPSPFHFLGGIPPFRPLCSYCSFFFLFLLTWPGFIAGGVCKNDTQHRDEVLDIKFSPDGTKLATCSRDKSIMVYSIDLEDDDEEEDDRGRGVFEGSEGVGGGGKGGGDLEVSGVAWRGPRRQGYGRLSVRLIYWLRSATVSVCRIFW